MGSLSRYEKQHKAMRNHHKQEMESRKVQDAVDQGEKQTQPKENQKERGSSIVAW